MQLHQSPLREQAGETGRPVSPATVGALFAGSGSLELALFRVLPHARLRWVSETDPAARKVLAHHHPYLPNHGDITTIAWDQVEPVSIITGGSPCQDLSTAEPRTGLAAHTRSGLWDYMKEGIKNVQPAIVFWENVHAATSAPATSNLQPCPGCVGNPPAQPAMRALGRVLADLATLGFNAEWHSLRASDIGAPHHRQRIFVLAWHPDRNPHHILHPTTSTPHTHH